jgi:hypothetical protein
MVEKLQAGSEKQPEAHLNDVNGAIAAAKKENPAAAALAGPDGGGGGGASKTEDPVIDGLITAPIKVLSVATALADGLAGGGNSGQSGPKNQTSNIGGVAGSQFVGGGTRAPTPLVPLTYREMVEAAKRARRLAAKLKDKGKDGAKHLGSSVFGRVETAGLSLTGGSLSDSEKADGQKRNGVPIKGIAVTAAAAAGVAIITKLYKERATTLNVMDGDKRYNNNPLLLVEDIKKGSQRAKQALKKAPPIRPQSAST